MKILVAFIVIGYVVLTVMQGMRAPRFKTGDAISIRQCTRGYWYQEDHGKYKSDEFACTHYHVTLTRMK